MILAVFGPREYRDKSPFEDFTLVESHIRGYQNITRIITGGGAGVEQLALLYATRNGIDPKVIPPNIARDGRRDAFKFRNIEIADKADHVLILWNGYGEWFKDLIPTIIQRGKHLDIRAIDDTTSNP